MKTKPIPFTDDGITFNFEVVISHYSNGNTALQIIDEMKCTDEVLTIDPVHPIDPALVVLDTSGFPWIEEFLTSHNIAEKTNTYIDSGLCKRPIYKLNLDAFAE